MTPDPPPARCTACDNEIDPDCCWCGTEKVHHRWVDDHPFVPLGCDCYRAKEEL